MYDVNLNVFLIDRSYLLQNQPYNSRQNVAKIIFSHGPNPEDLSYQFIPY